MHPTAVAFGRCRLANALLSPGGMTDRTGPHSPPDARGQPHGNPGPGDFVVEYRHQASGTEPRLVMLRFLASGGERLLRATFSSHEEAGPRFEQEAASLAAGAQSRAWKRLATAGDGLEPLPIDGATVNQPDVPDSVDVLWSLTSRSGRRCAATVREHAAGWELWVIVGERPTLTEVHLHLEWALRRADRVRATYERRGWR